MDLTARQEEQAAVTKLSASCIAMQALMDAYDSFLHLSVAAPVQMLNTYSFAVVSMLKFSLFALVEAMLQSCCHVSRGTYID